MLVSDAQPKVPLGLPDGEATCSSSVWGGQNGGQISQMRRQLALGLEEKEMAALPVPCTTPAAATNEEMAVVTSGLTQGGGAEVWHSRFVAAARMVHGRGS